MECGPEEAAGDAGRTEGLENEDAAARALNEDASAERPAAAERHEQEAAWRDAEKTPLSEERPDDSEKFHLREDIDQGRQLQQSDKTKHAEEVQATEDWHPHAIQQPEPGGTQSVEIQRKIAHEEDEQLASSQDRDGGRALQPTETLKDAAETRRSTHSLLAISGKQDHLDESEDSKPTEAPGEALEHQDETRDSKVLDDACIEKTDDSGNTSETEDLKDALKGIEGIEPADNLETLILQRDEAEQQDSKALDEDYIVKADDTHIKSEMEKLEGSLVYVKDTVQTENSEIHNKQVNEQREQAEVKDPSMEQEFEDLEQELKNMQLDEQLIRAQEHEFEDLEQVEALEHSAIADEGNEPEVSTILEPASDEEQPTILLPGDALHREKEPAFEDLEKEIVSLRSHEDKDAALDSEKLTASECERDVKDAAESENSEPRASTQEEKHDDAEEAGNVEPAREQKGSDVEHGADDTQPAGADTRHVQPQRTAVEMETLQSVEVPGDAEHQQETNIADEAEDVETSQKRSRAAVDTATICEHGDAGISVYVTEPDDETEVDAAEDVTSEAWSQEGESPHSVDQKHAEETSKISEDDGDVPGVTAETASTAQDYTAQDYTAATQSEEVTPGEIHKRNTCSDSADGREQGAETNEAMDVELLVEAQGHTQDHKQEQVTESAGPGNLVPSSRPATELSPSEENTQQEQQKLMMPDISKTLAPTEVQPAEPPAQTEATDDASNLKDINMNQQHEHNTQKNTQSIDDFDTRLAREDPDQLNRMEQDGGDNAENQPQAAVAQATNDLDKTLPTFLDPSEEKLIGSVESLEPTEILDQYLQQFEESNLVWNLEMDSNLGRAESSKRLNKLDGTDDTKTDNLQQTQRRDRPGEIEILVNFEPDVDKAGMQPVTDGEEAMQLGVPEQDAKIKVAENESKSSSHDDAAGQARDSQPAQTTPDDSLQAESNKYPKDLDQPSPSDHKEDSEVPREQGGEAERLQSVMPPTSEQEQMEAPNELSETDPGQDQRPQHGDHDGALEVLHRQHLRSIADDDLETSQSPVNVDIEHEPGEAENLKQEDIQQGEEPLNPVTDKQSEKSQSSEMIKMAERLVAGERARGDDESEDTPRPEPSPTTTPRVPPQMPSWAEATATAGDIDGVEKPERGKSEEPEKIEHLQSVAPTAEDQAEVFQSAEMTHVEASPPDETTGLAEPSEDERNSPPGDSQGQVEPLQSEMSQRTTERAKELDECENLQNKDNEMKEEVMQLEFLKATRDEQTETGHAAEVRHTATSSQREEAATQEGDREEKDTKRLASVTPTLGDGPDMSRSAEITEAEMPLGTTIRDADRETHEAQGLEIDGRIDTADNVQLRPANACDDDQSEMPQSTDILEAATKPEKNEHSEQEVVRERGAAEHLQPECPPADGKGEMFRCDEITEWETVTSAEVTNLTDMLGKDECLQSENEEQQEVQLQPLLMSTGGCSPPEKPEVPESVGTAEGTGDADALQHAAHHKADAACQPPVKLLIDEPTEMPHETEVLLINEDTNPQHGEPEEGATAPSLGHERAMQGDTSHAAQLSDNSSDQPDRKEPESPGKNIKDTLQSLIHCNVVESSQGMILESSVKGNMHISKYTLMNPDSQPEIEKEKTIHGDIGSILDQLLTHREPEKQEVAIEKEEQGNLKEILDKLMTHANKCESDREGNEIDSSASDYPDSDVSGIKNGILIQECLQGNVKMTVYSLQNQDDNGSSHREEVIAGNVKEAKESLFSSAEKTTPRRVELDYIRKGNVRFYTTCINSGALGYLQLLQDQGELDESALLGADSALLGAESAGRLAAPCDADERVDVKAIRKSFEAAAKECGNENAIKVPVWPQYCASNIKSGTASERASGEALNAASQQSEAPLNAGGCSTSREAGDPSAAEENTNKAEAETQSTCPPQHACEDVVRVNVKDTRRSFEEAKHLVREVQREEVIRGNVEAAKQSLIESFNRGKEVVRQVDIAEDLQNLQRNAPLVQQSASVYHDSSVLAEATDNCNQASAEDHSPASPGTTSNWKASDIREYIHHETQTPARQHSECQAGVQKDPQNVGGKLTGHKAPQENTDSNEQSLTGNANTPAYKCANENARGLRDESDKAVMKQSVRNPHFQIPPPEPSDRVKHVNLHEELPLPAPPLECELEGSLPPPPPEVLAAVIAEDLPLPPPPPPDALKDDARPPSNPASPSHGGKHDQEPAAVRKLPFRVRTLDMPGPPISSYAPIPFRKKTAGAQPSQDKTVPDASRPKQNESANVADMSPNKLKQYLKNQESSCAVTLQDINAINKYLESNVENFHITSGPIVRPVVFKPDKSSPQEASVISPQQTSPQNKSKPVTTRAFKTPLMIAEENFKRQQAEKKKDKTSGLTSVPWKDSHKGDDPDGAFSNKAAYLHDNVPCDESASLAQTGALIATESTAHCVIFTNKALTKNQQLNLNPQRPTEATVTVHQGEAATTRQSEEGSRSPSTRTHGGGQQSTTGGVHRVATEERSHQQGRQLAHRQGEASVRGSKGAAGAEPQGECLAVNRDNTGVRAHTRRMQTCSSKYSARETDSRVETRRVFAASKPRVTSENTHSAGPRGAGATQPPPAALGENGRREFAGKMSSAKENLALEDRRGFQQQTRWQSPTFIKITSVARNPREIVREIPPLPRKLLVSSPLLGGFSRGTGVQTPPRAPHDTHGPRSWATTACGAGGAAPSRGDPASERCSSCTQCGPAAGHAADKQSAAVSSPPGRQLNIHSTISAASARTADAERMNKAQLLPILLKLRNGKDILKDDNVTDKRALCRGKDVQRIHGSLTSKSSVSKQLWIASSDPFKVNVPTNKASLASSMDEDLLILERSLRETELLLQSMCENSQQKSPLSPGGCQHKASSAPAPGSCSSHGALGGQERKGDPAGPGPASSL